MDRTGRVPNYDRSPYVPAGTASDLEIGWGAIARRLRATGARVIVIDAYPGTFREDLEELVDRLAPDERLCSTDALKSEEEIDALVAADVTDDAVFGRITQHDLVDLFDPALLRRMSEAIQDIEGRVVVYGTGASLVARGDVLVFADLARWEIQQRQRGKEIANLGSSNFRLRPGLKYKRSFFVDWQLADRHKLLLFDDINFFLDTTEPARPKLANAAAVWTALRGATKRPFRVVPFFDPAPWGGHWMEEVCDLPDNAPNHGWCFDCVPEENSILLGFGHERFELPSLDLVLRYPTELLGESVHHRFGGEFPIRFDLLDTVDGGNLSLQVHPLTGYIKEQFGMAYTQDESYYMLDAAEGASVYLGLKKGADRRAMLRDLRRAEQGGFLFPDEKYVNRFTARRHDHFLIPAGTVHCSGTNSLVLEISATPYIFTFKLWDWGRLGLDGRPRPLHIDHGECSIQWDRDTSLVRDRLINQISPLRAENEWYEERTGLHEAEFIDTHRHWFVGRVPHTGGTGVNVLNLVQGEEAIIESPDRAFDPFVVHFAETFIVPAAAGPYTITPYGRAEGTELATIKAFVRADLD
ncbi:MAG: mannose-6-phosphate isomerase [Actinomycetota bacterium]